MTTTLPELTQPSPTALASAAARPEFEAMLADLTKFWTDYGYQLVLGALIATAALLVVSLWLAHRRSNVPRWVANVTGVLVLAISAEGMWEVATQTLELPGMFAGAVFFFAEAMMLSSAIQARYHYQEHKHPGKHGTAVWVIAVFTGLIVAVNATTKVEALLRLLLPIGAAYQWWNSLTAEGTKKPQGTWRWTPRRLLMYVGAIESKATDVDVLDTERRVRVMTGVALSVHRTRRPHWWWAWRLERLAMTADDELVAAVHERIRRVVDIRDLTSPGRPVALEDRLNTFLEEVRGTVTAGAEQAVQLAEEAAVQAAVRISSERADRPERRAVHAPSSPPVQPSGSGPVRGANGATRPGRNGAVQQQIADELSERTADDRPPNAPKMEDPEAVKAMLEVSKRPDHKWTQRAVRDLTGAGPERIKRLLPLWQDAAEQAQAEQSSSPAQDPPAAGEPATSSTSSAPVVRPDETAADQPAPSGSSVASSPAPEASSSDREPVPVAAG